jgi:hypothetical protein
MIGCSFVGEWPAFDAGENKVRTMGMLIKVLIRFLLCVLMRSLRFSAVLSLGGWRPNTQASSRGGDAFPAAAVAKPGAFAA